MSKTTTPAAFVSFAPFVILAFVSFGASNASEASARSSGASAQDNRALIDQAFAAAYNLDHADAIALLDKAIAMSPNDPDAHRAAAGETPRLQWE